MMTISEEPEEESEEQDLERERDRGLDPVVTGTGWGLDSSRTGTGWGLDSVGTGTETGMVDVVGRFGIGADAVSDIGDTVGDDVASVALVCDLVFGVIT